VSHFDSRACGRCLTTAAIGVILLNSGVGLSVLAERSRQLRRHEGFGGEALDAVRQGSPVDFFAIFVGHPNEAPENLIGASVASQLSRQLISVRLCRIDKTPPRSGVCVGWVKGENSREKAKVAMGIARYEIRQPKKGTAAD
jgi:hypothetical protein